MPHVAVPLLRAFRVGRGLEQADLLLEEAVVAAGGHFLHDLTSPVTGEAARVAQPRGAGFERYR